MRPEATTSFIMERVRAHFLNGERRDCIDIA